MRSLLSKMRVLSGAILFAFWGTAGAYWIGFAPTPVTVGLNSSFTIDIVISGLATDGQLLSTYDFSVGYDLSMLQFQGAQPSGALGAGSTFLATPGVDLAGDAFVNLFGLSNLPDADLVPLQGDYFSIATLTFTGIGLGTSPIFFSELLALGGSQVGSPGQTVTTDLLAITHTVGDASVVTAVNAVPEPGTLSLALLALLLFAAQVKFRRR
jgi:hypothetical protein